MEKRFFYLYACCILVKGYNRSIIVDVQRGQIHFIPNSLYDILKDYRNKDVSWIQNYFEKDKRIEEYFNFLIDKELGCFMESLKQFPPLDTSFHSPRIISNATIEIQEESNHNYKNIFAQLDNLNCEAIELRFQNEISMSNLNSILNITKGSSFRSITIIIPYTDEFSPNNLLPLLTSYPRIKNVIIYKSAFFERKEVEFCCVVYNKQKSILAEHCGKVSLDNFSLTFNMIKESKHYNSCLNKKIAIAKDGTIKNCPSDNKNWGNIEDIKIKDVLKNIEFKKYWNIGKDKIEVCKDCEFRYVCNDCRVYITDPSDIYSKPSKCKYDPYTNKWR